MKGYLKRKADVFLKKWKDSPGHKPLVIKGARQIGKTSTILEFAHSHYESVVYLNFAEDSRYKNIANSGFSADAIVKNISVLVAGAKFIPGKTLIVFDELQDFPEIATSFKFFAIDGRYDIIASGSLLGINFHKIQSNSVGYKTDYDMFGLDFEEFLQALGYDGSIVDSMLGHFRTLTPFNSNEMTKFSELFVEYCVLGGFPEVIRSYLDRGDFQDVRELQLQLLGDYREDIRKYAFGIETMRILSVFESIPAQLGKENKKFQISKVEHGARFKDYFGYVDWLVQSGSVDICHCLNYPELPLAGNYDPQKYKLYYNDTGLLLGALDREITEDLMFNKNIGTYKGALFENFVASTLTKMGKKLYYYKREDSRLEEDFFIRVANWLVPVEVKATDGNAKSLKTLIASDKYPEIKYGIKLSAGNIGFENNVLAMPCFCTFLLDKAAGIVFAGAE